MGKLAFELHMFAIIPPLYTFLRPKFSFNFVDCFHTQISIHIKHTRYSSEPTFCTCGSCLAHFIYFYYGLPMWHVTFLHYLFALPLFPFFTSLLDPFSFWCKPCAMSKQQLPNGVNCQKHLQITSSPSPRHERLVFDVATWFFLEQ
jgi:hypothetical protein